MKTLFLILIGISIVTGSVSKGRAAGSVNMSATVVERKSTDTINDFDFSSINTNIQPHVLGTSTEKNTNFCSKENSAKISSGLWQKIINLFR